MIFDWAVTLSKINMTLRPKLITFEDPPNHFQNNGFEVRATLFNDQEAFRSRFLFFLDL